MFKKVGEHTPRPTMALTVLLLVANRWRSDAPGIFWCFN